ncbi:DUF2335 domain-containing protein [uncultured Sutterella sp.]|uniref:DUF2335 domain-containing protein n=1 Tax=uncultured Sutterella sp. TaxID=286133 RepID=UPI00280C0A7D|nr:DUF2335 domain-containing protein [uncultured Sutterella sp.]
MSRRKANRAPASETTAKAGVVNQTNVVLSASRSEHFEGPLPHPNILSQYDKVCPGLANRIVEMAEREQAARLQAIAENDARKKEITGRACKDSEENIRATKRGQICGLIITAACVACAFYCALTDKPVAEVIAFLAIPTASFIGSFMPKWWSHKNEKDNS